MLNNDQIKVVQIAVRAAGLRHKDSDGQYRLLLSQYKQPNGSHVTSCKQLNNSQMEDLLAICESMGWRYPGKAENYFRQKIAHDTGLASYAQQSAIKKLAGDLGWNFKQLSGFVFKITKHRVDSTVTLSPGEAYAIIEALKSMFLRNIGMDPKAVTLGKIKSLCTEANDG